ncbi:hypothetical protein Tco_0674592 [Tanacetum coccineum]
MEEFVTENQENYYSGITSITINGKDAYELKGSFLDDLCKNAFSGTNEEDAVEHIEYFLKIVDPIDLPNVNHERLRLAVFPISLVGNASKWFDEFKGSITTWVMGTDADMEYDPFNFEFSEWLASKFYNHKTMDRYTKNALWLYWTRGNDEVEFTNEEFSDLDDKNLIDKEEVAEIFRIETDIFDFETPLWKAFDEFNYLLKLDTKLFTHDIKRIKTYEDYMNKRNNELDEPWSENGVPYEICDHICEPFCFKNGKAKWPTCNSNEDGFCNGGELPRMVRVGYMTYFHDYEWYDDLTDSSLKDEALKQKAIYKKSWGDATQSEVEYVAIKEYEYDDLTNEDACQAYQEIFRNMDEGWLVTRAE